MPRFLLVSGSEKAGQSLREILLEREVSEVVACAGAEEAKALLEGDPFDCCIINAPLRGEDGAALALALAEATQAQIMLLCPQEFDQHAAAKLSALGVMTIEKPVGRRVLISSLELMQTVQRRVALLQTQNQKLEQKLSEMKLITRAKCVLISSLGMSETQAHKHMERQAMNQRISKYEVALNVLKVYEDRPR